MAFDVDQFLKSVSPDSPGSISNDLSDASANKQFDVNNFLKGLSNDSDLPDPTKKESSYADVLSAAPTNAKLDLMKAIGGILNATGSDVGPIIQNEASAESKENQPNVTPGTLKSKIGAGAQMGLESVPALLASLTPAGPVAGAALFGAQGFGNTYAEQNEAGRTGSSALVPAAISGVANAAIGFLPLGVITNAEGGVATRALKGAIAGEFGGQSLNAIQQGINKGTIDPNMTWEQFKKSASDVLGVGAGIGAAGSLIHPAPRAPLDEITSHAGSTDQYTGSLNDLLSDNNQEPLAPPASGTVASPVDLTNGQNYNVPAVGGPRTDYPSSPAEVITPHSSDVTPDALLKNATNDPGTIYQPSAQQQEAINSALVAKDIANNVEQQSTPKLTDQRSNNESNNSQFQDARDMRSQALNNVIDLRKGISPSIDDINIQSKLKDAADTYRNIDNTTKQGTATLPIENHPIILSQEAGIDSAQRTLNAIRSKKYANIDNNMAHDLVENGHVTVTPEGDLALTTAGKNLAVELDKLSRLQEEELFKAPVNNETISKEETVAQKNAEENTSGKSSLLDFISNSGGIKDTGGDLNAMDAGLWHKDKPFRNKLINNENGLNPDDAALYAKESGYFPEIPDRPTINELYDAINNELAGKKRFKEGEEKIAPFDQSKEDHDYMTAAHDLGINTDDMTMDQLRQEIDQHNTPPDAGEPTIHSDNGDIPFSVQPSDKFIAQKDDIRNKITNIVKKINPSVDIKIIDKMFGEGQALKNSGAATGERQEVAGAYDRLRNLVYASLNTEKWNPIDTAYHEAFHSIYKMLSDADKSILSKRFPSTDKMTHEEHVATEFARFMTEKNATGFSPAVRRVFLAIQQALREIGRTLKLGKFNSIDDVFNRIEKGDVYANSAERSVADSIKNINLKKLNEIAQNESITPEQMRKIVKQISPELHDVVYSKEPISDSDRMVMSDMISDTTGDPHDAMYSITEHIFGKNAPDMEKVRRTFIKASEPFVGKKRAAEALHELETDIKIAHSQINKTSSKLPGAELLARTLVQSSDGALRFVQDIYKSETIGKVRNMFYHDAGEGKSNGATYFEALDQYVKPRLNSIAKVVKGMNESDLTKVVDMLQHPEKSFSYSNQVKEATSTIAKIIDENRKYLKEAGIDIGEVKGYFPRIYDNNKIVADPDGFKQAAIKAYESTYPEMSKEEVADKADQWLYNILQQDQLGISSGRQDFSMFGGVQPKPSHLKERILTKEADDALKDYMVRNPVDAMVPFLNRSARKAEFNRRFGNIPQTNAEIQSGIKPTNRWEQLKEQMRSEGVDAAGIDQVMDTIIRNTGLNSSPRTKVNDTLSILKYMSNLAFLPKATLSSIPEAFTIATRTGDLGLGLTALKDGYAAFLKTKGTESIRERAEMEGLIGEIANEMTMAQRSGGYSNNEKINRLNSKFFKSTLLERLTSGQIAAVNKGARYAISKWSDSIRNESSYKKSSELMLKELGIPENKIDSFTKWVAENGGKDISTESVMGNNEMANIYAIAKRRFVNDVIQEPTAATRQRYANTPFGQFAYGLSSFTNSYSKRVLLRSVNMLNEAGATIPSIPYKVLKASINAVRGNFKGARANIDSIIPAFNENIAKGYTTSDRVRLAMQTAMIIPLMALGAAVREGRDLIDSDPDQKKRSTADRVMTDLSASNIFGSYDSTINMFGGLRYQRDPLTMFSGPLPAIAATGIKTIGNYALNNTDKSNTQQRNIAKQVYGLGIAPMLTSIVSNNVPYARISFPVIQAIASKNAKSAFTNAVAGKKKPTYD